MQPVQMRKLRHPLSGLVGRAGAMRGAEIKEGAFEAREYPREKRGEDGAWPGY